MEYRVIFLKFNPYVDRAYEITHSISSSLLILAFYGLVHNLSIMIIFWVVGAVFKEIRACKITHSISSSLLISAFYSPVHNLSIRIILTIDLSRSLELSLRTFTFC